MTGARSLEQRALALAPTPRDAALVQEVLDRAGVPSCACATIAEVCKELDGGVGVVLIAEEALFQAQAQAQLVEWIEGQPPWSDLPVLVLARPGADSAAVSRAMDALGNVTVLERPMRVSALVSAVRAALRARKRQYQVREQMAARERDLESLALLGAIIASSDDAILSKSLDGNILTWNKGAERLLGYSAEEAIGQPILLVIPADRVAEEASILERLRHGEHLEHFETVRVAKDGHKIDVSMTVSPIRNERGAVIGISTVARDITERKQAEVALREADRRKDEFLAILAHELRNPLAPIRNSLHILRLSVDGDPVTKRVTEMMERQVGHLVRLVDDLLEVSRITRGTIDLRREPIEAAAVVRSAVDTSRPLIEAGKHRLSVELPAEPLRVDADPTRVSQVVANLLNNAAKYTHEGGKIWLTVRRDGDTLVLSVRDNGIGIAPELMPRIFETFSQGNRSAERSRGGLGIGLMLVKRLVEMHGGRVEAKSAGPDQGSEFVVRLPLARGAIAEARPQSESRLPAPAAAPRTLVVDDNSDSAETLAVLLRLLGAEARVVYGGPDALQALEDYRPEVVFLDIGMPEMDGYEVARRIRARHGNERMKLIALTGWGQEEDRRRSQQAGFDHHMTKPADLSVLESLLKGTERG